MASSSSRNHNKPSSVHGFDSPHGTDKMQSSTLKRQPSPEWSKTDLLRLLSHFEGELQARDVSIATLKAEKAKQLLYQAKYGRFGLGDPFVALQRDAEGKNDAGFDEAAIKSMYDNQLAQLENLIATQRKAQLKMREQLGNSEKRFHKVCTELEDEKQKHAQDTAQGDDVTYMLEKERERLKAEIDFEKSQNKKLEKDLKKTLVGLEEEKANAARHKQVAIMLIKERKHLIENIIAENKLRDDAENALHSEKSKTVNMAEGLAQESKKSLKMEMAMEKQHNEFDSERDALRKRLYDEEIVTKSLKSEVSRLSKQVEALQQQIKSSGSTPSSIHMRSSASPARTINPVPAKTTERTPPSYSNPTQVQSVSPSFVHPYNPQQISSATASTAAKTGPSHQLMPPGGAIRPGIRSSTKVVDGGRIGSSSPEREVIYRPDTTASSHASSVSQRRNPGPSSSMRVAPVGASSSLGRVGERLEVDVGPTPGMSHVVNVSPGSSAIVTTHGGGKISFHVSGGGSTQSQHQHSPGSHLQRKVGQGPSSSLPVGRGTPPPIPPNKPNFGPPPGPGSKPWPPPKASGSVGSGMAQAPGKDVHAGQYSSPSAHRTGAVQIPVNFVSGSSSPSQQLSPSNTSQSGGSGKNVVASVRTQCVVDSSPLHGDVLTVNSSSSSSLTHSATESPSLEFLGPEMDNLHQLLASMTTDNKSQSSSHIKATPLSEDSSIIVTSQPINPPVNTTTHNLPLENSFTNCSQFIAASTQSPLILKEQNDNSICRDDSKESDDTIPPHDTHTATKISIVHPNQASTNITRPVSLNLNAKHVVTSVSSSNPSQKATRITVSTNSASLTSHQNESTLSSSSLSYNSSQLNTANSVSSVSSVHIQHTPMSSLLSSSDSSFVMMEQNSLVKLPLVRPTLVSLMDKSQPHRLASRGDIQTLHDCLHEQGGAITVNQMLKDGTTPLHCAVEFNQEACVKFLLENGAKPSCLRDDRITPLHIAAAKGHTGCVRILLGKGAAVNMSAAENQTPLHLAVKGIHLECCQLLLRHGANVLYVGQDGLTSLHYAVQASQPEILQILLDRLKLNGTSRDSDAAHQLVAITDDQGWSIAHMAAHLLTQECLIKLAESLPLDFSAQDKLGRNVREVSSPTCQYLLADIDRPSSPSLKVQVELHYYLAHSFVSSAQIGNLDINPGISWRIMEDRLRATLKSYLAQLDVGLKTRRINRLDLDMNWMDKDFTLGLTMNNIKHFEMGFYTWTPGMQTETSPYLILCNNEHKRVTIIVDDTTNMCDLIAFDILHPVSSISNYLRLLEQYKSVIFYGPTGCGKSYLAHRLAQWIAAQENAKGKKPSIYQLSLNQGFTSSKFLTFLKQRGCVVPVRRDPDNQVPILLLDNLETVDIARLFGELLDPIEYRGIGHAFCLKGDDDQANGMHYFQDNFYVIGTMNKSRSLGVDLSVLPRFRWIQFRLDTEPLRGLLARHFLRRLLNMNRGCLPAQEDVIFRAVEWIVCVWQRLNDSLLKLGLPEVIMGPCSFFKCPLEKRDMNHILEWIKNVWNQQVAPRVREAVKRGTGSEAPSDGQQKVANTALYVLMQRSIILGCPLVGQVKENYLAGFCGSNELDIPLKAGDGRPKTTSSVTGKGGTVQSSLQQGRIQQGAGADGVNGVKTGRSPAQTSPSPSDGGYGSSNERNGRGHVRNFLFGTSNIKRRSLSESSVSKAAQLEEQQEQNSQQQHQQQQDSHLTPTDSNQNLLSQAKVARLEVKSPKLLSIPALLRSSATPKSSQGDVSSPSQTPKKTGRVSPLLSSVTGKTHSSSPTSTSSPKKSRSSENISSSGLYQGFSNRANKPTSPFSFSLATPTSKLSSFKVFDSTSTSDQDNYSSLLQEMPDFSIFNETSSPTEELPSRPGFVAVGKQRELKRPQDETKKNEEEEVWSRREDIFVPISSSGSQFQKEKDV